MHRIPLSFLLLIAAAPLWAKDRKPQKPDWLSGVSAQYPKAAYIIGVGQGPTQDKAADRARTEIAKAFSLSLSATSSESATESNGAGSQTVSDDVRTSTRKVMDGVEIAQYWDDGEGTLYALAVLDRAHSAAIIKDKLDDIDKSLPALQEQLGKTDGKFAKLKLALKLMRLAKSRRRLNADYRVLAADGKGIPAPAALNESLGQARAAIEAVKIQVQTAGVHADETTSRIMDGLAAYGLKVAEKGGEADVVVQAKSSATPLTPEDITWYWAQGSINVRMSYGSTGEVFQRFEESGQEASRDPETSVGVTLTKLADRTADHVFKVLTSNDVLDD